MPNIRVRFKLNPGREGIAFSKLAKHAEGIENLLSSIAEDIGLLPEQNQWLGKEFRNGSLFSTAENQMLANDYQVSIFNEIISNLIKFSTKSSKELLDKISLKTLKYFADLRIPLEIDEIIGIGIYEKGKEKPRFYNVSKLKLEAVAKSIDIETSYIGSVIGNTYEWTKGAKEPFIKIRDVATDELIKCYYDDKDYRKVAKLFEIKDALVIISGNIIYNRFSEKTEVAKATDFEIAPVLTQEQYESFFGSAPNLTEGIDSATYIRNLRGDR